MYLFTRTQEIKRQRLYIPFIMRAALQLHDNANVVLTSEIQESSPYQNQILISSIPTESRSDFWNLKASFRDRPGIISELSSLLSNLSIHIINLTSTARDQNSEFVIDIDFCINDYVSEFDRDTTTRRNNPGQWPRELYARIICLFIKDLVFRPDGKPIIYIKQNDALAHSVDQVNYSESCKIINGFVRIPNKYLDAIRAQFFESYPKVRKPSFHPLAVLATDVEFRLILVNIFFSHTGHLHIRIDAINNQQTVPRISTVLFDLGFNIVQFSTRIIGAGERSITDIFLHLPPDKDKFKDDQKMHKWIESRFHGSSLNDFDCRVHFPPSLTLQDIAIDSSKVITNG